MAGAAWIAVGGGSAHGRREGTRPSGRAREEPPNTRVKGKGGALSVAAFVRGKARRRARADGLLVQWVVGKWGRKTEHAPAQGV